MLVHAKCVTDHAKGHTVGQTNQGGYLMGSIYNSYSVIVSFIFII